MGSSVVEAAEDANENPYSNKHPQKSHEDKEASPEQCIERRRRFKQTEKARHADEEQQNRPPEKNPLKHLLNHNSLHSPYGEKAAAFLNNSDRLLQTSFRTGCEPPRRWNLCRANPLALKAYLIL